MDKCCRYCKHYYNGYCKNIESNLKIEDSMPNVPYIEDGKFSEDLRESELYPRLYSLFIDKLRKEEVIKKRLPKDALGLIKEELLNTFIELIDEEVSTFFMYLKGDTDIIIENPESFYCCDWE